MDEMGIGSRIRAARKTRKLSQEAVARRAGMSLNGFADIERGRIEDPHYSTLSSIAQALGTSVAELVGETELAGKVDAPSSLVEEARRIGLVSGVFFEGEGKALVFSRGEFRRVALDSGLSDEQTERLIGEIDKHAAPTEKR